MSTENESQFEVDGVKLYAKTWTVGLKSTGGSSLSPWHLFPES